MANRGEPLIIPDQLRAAREALALSVEEVAHQLGISPQELIGWEKGVAAPSVEQLWQLSELYHRSTDYFVKRTPPFPAQLSFRVAQRNTMEQLSQEARQTIARFDELCRAQSELETLLGKPLKVLVEKSSWYGSPDELATRERERLRLGDKPIPDLRRVLTDQGIRIFELPIPQNDFTGLSWWHSEYGPCVLINAQDISGRRTFTLAHEYAHLLSPEAPTVCDLSDIAEERLANKFAAVFLMPTSDVQEAFRRLVRVLPGGWVNDDELAKLAQRYHVSLDAMGRRLEDLGLLPRGTAEERMAQWKARRRGYGRTKLPQWRRQLGEPFVSLALEAHLEGRVSLGRLARYLGIDARKALEAEQQSEARERPKGNI